MEFAGKLALITGGSSGIGLSIAQQISGKGSHVWILGRNAERLQAALEKVKAAQVSPDQRFGCLQADVTDPDQVRQAVSDLESAFRTPDILVTSAGVCHPGYVEELELETFREDMDANYFGTVYAVKAVLPGMLRRGSGAIVSICSGAGFIGCFGYSAYGGSKYAVRGFIDVLRSEMKYRGIQVSIVFPPDTDTPQLAFDRAHQPYETGLLSNIYSPPTTPDKVARITLKAVARGRYAIPIGFDPSLYYFLEGHFGDLVYPILDLLVKDAIKKKRKKEQQSASG